MYSQWKTYVRKVISQLIHARVSRLVTIYFDWEAKNSASNFPNKRICTVILYEDFRGNE